MIKKSMQSIAIMILAFFCFTSLSMAEAQEAETNGAAPEVYQQSAPAIASPQDSEAQETEEIEPATEEAAPEEYQELAAAIEVSENATAPEEFQDKAPIVPGFSIWPALSMLLTGLIILARKSGKR